MKEYKMILDSEKLKVKCVLVTKEEMSFEEAAIKAADMLSHYFYREKYII